MCLNVYGYLQRERWPLIWKGSEWKLCWKCLLWDSLEAKTGQWRFGGKIRTQRQNYLYLWSSIHFLQSLRKGTCVLMNPRREPEEPELGERRPLFVPLLRPCSSPLTHHLLLCCPRHAWYPRKASDGHTSQDQDEGREWTRRKRARISEVEEQTEGYTSGQRRGDVTSIFFIMESQCKQASVSSPKREKYQRQEWERNWTHRERNAVSAGKENTKEKATRSLKWRRSCQE